MTICRVCSQSIAEPVFSGRVLGRNVHYYECAHCGYVQTQEPDWLDEAYSSAINLSDTGIVHRNQLNAELVLATLTVIGKRHGRVVDCAGGYGILVRMLRDRGIEALWSDPYCQNLVARGFEHKGEPADLLTAFEVFEHFVNPVAEMERSLTVSPNLLISTELMPQNTPAPGQWWYYGSDHGQHIGFFRLKTLEYLAQKFGKHLITNGRNYHLFTENCYSAANWYLQRFLSRFFPRIYRLGLKQKITEDFRRMSGYTGKV